ncbi:cobalt-precorrin-5B (C(1))-methyltransferase [Magnetospirillum sp. ME-1]|uniref:cobalt-precorrin-5B (C(1))-methyltransferase n=1 Tax=Magnetospirillum sp. ME-1 TaxID=1639348 RepID=UPI000A17ACF4|nr:cobalt-precorrin-5B (C(1))-methyltransferase [Magnetospirillum sp. ME-1]ARJ65246.1 cobalt-precorrin-5B (C(1))-methyltransferase [Magnetospirillum sp. ME-1]
MAEDGKGKVLRSGWTTGACATAAAKAACSALLGGGFPDPVEIALPGGQTPAFALALAETGPGWARAAVVKDAGDDPDVTHGAMIIATIRHGQAGAGLLFRAGPGVGTVTRPGLPLAVGEAAINPVPRRLMGEALAVLAGSHGVACDFELEIAVPGGEDLALRTWNPRLGILGGISILGTTGVVIPYSCSAWIHSIQRGIDVARACGVTHVAGCVGSTSEKAVRRARGLGEEAIVDMGDFAGGMLKYLRRHPVPRVTIAGGFAKMCKLAKGEMDLHSSRSQVDMEWLARQLGQLGADEALVAAAARANTALQVLDLAGTLPLGQSVARQAEAAARAVLDNGDIGLDVLVVDRQGRVIGDSARSG